MANQPHTTSRRNILAAALLAPVAVSAPAIAMTAPSSADWDAAMARYLAAKDKHERFNEAARPAWEKAEAAMPTYTIAPHARNGFSATIRISPQELENYAPGNGEIDGYTFIRPQIQAMKVQHEEYQRIKKEVRYDELAEMSERYCNAMIEAEEALIAMPAPHLRAVEWKLAYWQQMSADNEIEPDSYVSVLADVRRLAA